MILQTNHYRLRRSFRCRSHGGNIYANVLSVEADLTQQRNPPVVVMFYVELQDQRFARVQPVRFVLDVKPEVVLCRYVLEICPKNEHLPVEDDVDEDAVQRDVGLEPERAVPGFRGVLLFVVAEDGRAGGCFLQGFGRGGHEEERDDE